jgi:hypothetical protein
MNIMYFTVYFIYMQGWLLFLTAHINIKRLILLNYFVNVNKKLSAFQKIRITGICQTMNINEIAKRAGVSTATVSRTITAALKSALKPHKRSGSLFDPLTSALIEITAE